MTRNNKMVLGVAAGVAALAVAGMYAKKKGYLDNVNTSNLKDKLSGLKDTAMKAFGGSSATENSAGSNGNSMNSFSSSNESNGASKRKSTSTGTTGSINPATT